jgi:Fic family protein
VDVRRAGPAPTPTFARTPHLVELVAEAEQLVGRLRTAPEAERLRLAPLRADEATLATLRLDGSPLQAVPDLEAAARDMATPEAHVRRGSWIEAMGRLEDAPDEHLQALECLGTLAGLGSDDLAERLLVDTVDALSELHRRLTLGLVAEGRGGMVRISDQAVHDASVGRILYFASDPADIPRQLALLGSWSASSGSREHGLVTSGILHLELLRIHPFDAANGRLARTAARLVLRARGLDPDGLACPEPALAEDALGYHEEVASTRRRGDAGIWLERWGEAVTAGLRDSARRLGVQDTRVPHRAETFLDGLTDDAFTIADYRAIAALQPRDAAADLRALLDAGRIRRVAGSRGLRFARRSASAGTEA